MKSTWMWPAPPNMRWCEVIVFHRPLRGIRVRAPVTEEDGEKSRREAEHAAYERGRHDGERALSEQLMAQRAELLELHQGVVESLRQAVPKVIQETERALMDLAIETASRLVAGLPIGAETVEAAVREAIGQLQHGAEVTLFLNPDDLALLRKHQSPILQGLPESGSVKFIASPDVSRGGCLAQTRFGTLDTRRETKLQQLREAVA